MLGLSANNLFHALFQSRKEGFSLDSGSLKNEPMIPKSEFITIDNNLEKIEAFINEIIIAPKHALKRWAVITNQTPAAKIGYIGQHLTSLITGVQGTGSGMSGSQSG